jgi:hypothetical protein
MSLADELDTRPGPHRDCSSDPEEPQDDIVDLNNIPDDDFMETEHEERRKEAEKRGTAFVQSDLEDECDSDGDVAL